MPKPARGAGSTASSNASASYVGNGLQGYLPPPVRCESPERRSKAEIIEEADPLTSPLTPSALLISDSVEEGRAKQMYGQELVTVPEDDFPRSEDEVVDPDGALSDTPAQPSRKLRERTRRRSGLTRKFSSAGVSYVYTGPERARDVSEEFLDQDAPLHMKGRDLQAQLAPPEASELFVYLEKFGYKTQHAHSWPARSEKSVSWPKITLDQINGHEERAGHTWYFLMCHLKVKGLAARHWCVQRRLSQMRSLLHDPIKQETRDHYDLYFDEARFASRGGLKGTTKTLQTWLATWAAAINAAQVPPHLLGLTLRFLEAPPLFGDAGEPLVPSSARSEHRRPPTPLTGRSISSFPVQVADDAEYFRSTADEMYGGQGVKRAEQAPAAGIAPTLPSRNSDISARTAGAAATSTSRASGWDAADFNASRTAGAAATATSRVSAWDAADFAAAELSRAADDDDFMRPPPAAPAQASGDAQLAHDVWDTELPPESFRGVAPAEMPPVAPALVSRISGFDADDFAVSPTRAALTTAVSADPHDKFGAVDGMLIDSEGALPNLR